MVFENTFFIILTGLSKMPPHQGALGMLYLHLIYFVAKQSISGWPCLNNLNYFPLATHVFDMVANIHLW